MTSYNREKYIGAAIESVLASGFQDFELIVTDDCSIDNTLQIAKSYASKDERVKVFRNEKNLGDYPNRNQAASYATGKYLKYVDADDCIYPWGLELLVTMMEQFPQAGWGLCSLEQNKEKPFPFILSPEETYLYHYKGPGLFHKAPLSSIIKRETFEAVGGFNPIRMAGDFDMWHRLAQHFPVVLMPHGIVWYREHGEQEVNSYRKFVKVYEKIKIKHLQDSKVPLSKRMAGEIYRSEKYRVIRLMVRAMLTLNQAEIKDNFLRIRQYYGR